MMPNLSVPLVCQYDRAAWIKGCMDSPCHWTCRRTRFPMREEEVVVVDARASFLTWLIEALR